MRRVSFLCTVFMISPTLALGCSEPSSDVRIPRAPSKNFAALLRALFQLLGV